MLKRICHDEVSWEEFERDWAEQCAPFSESLDNFAPAHLPMLKEAATNSPSSGTFALPYDDGFAAACQLNYTPLPGYVGPVLRLRFLTLAPRYDLGDTDVETYSDIIVKTMLGVLSVSDTLWQTEHVKFHLASPADRAFFAALGKPLGESGAFDRVCVKGSWLYITKKQTP